MRPIVRNLLAAVVVLVLLPNVSCSLAPIRLRGSLETPPGGSHAAAAAASGQSASAREPQPFINNTLTQLESMMGSAPVQQGIHPRLAQSNPTSPKLNSSPTPSFVPSPPELPSASPVAPSPDPPAASMEPSSAVLPSIAPSLSVTPSASPSPSAAIPFVLPPASSAYLSSGPYLQAMSPSAVTIVWRPVSYSSRVARVYVGDALRPGSYHLMFEAQCAGLDCAVPVTGLQPQTKYAYTVCSATACTPGATSTLQMTFTTSPPYGAQQPVRMLLLGDPGRGIGTVTQTLQGARIFMRGRDPDMWLMNGDNAYESGSDSEYTRNLIAFLRSDLSHVPLWTTLGNHDLKSNSAGQIGPYFDRFKLPSAGEAGGVPSGTAAYYSFDYGNVHVVVLDAMYSSRLPNGAMIQWLQRDLAALDSTRTKWLIAMWHHAAYSKGGHDSDKEVESIELRTHALPLLEAAGLDLLLNGHSHCYERSQFLRGHWGPSTTFNSSTHVTQPGLGGGVQGGAPYTKPALLSPFKGFVSVTMGSTGQLDDTRGNRASGFNHPAMVPQSWSTEWPQALYLMGTVVVDIDADTMNVVFISGSGQVADSFVIVKGAALG